MASLYTRAEPFERALLRVVEGQVHSFRADHPEAELSVKDARGIAKRIVGNIVSDWARLSEVRGIDHCAPSEASGCQFAVAAHPGSAPFEGALPGLLSAGVGNAPPQGAP
jgi:hypothetical protein